MSEPPCPFRACDGTGFVVDEDDAHGASPAAAARSASSAAARASSAP